MPESLPDLMESHFIDKISSGIFESFVASTGIAMERINREDDFGVDFMVKEVYERNGKVRKKGIAIFEVQLKGSTNWELKNDEIVYDLKAKNYNDMIDRLKNDDIRIVLVLMCLPNETRIWDCCSVDFDRIQYTKSLFFFELEDYNAVHSKEDSTKRIRIPITNVLNQSRFKALVEKYKAIRIE